MAKLELTAAQTADLQAAKEASDELRRQIDLLEASHIDASELRKRYELMERQRQALLANFSPGTSARRGGR